MMTDPVSDMLTRIRNAGRARQANVAVPASKLKLGIARVMVDKGFLDAVEEDSSDDGHPELRITLRLGRDGTTIIDGMRRVSRPSRRVYVGAKEVPRVRGGLGIAIMSTPRGVMADDAAREQNVGGEVMCEVW